MLIICSEKLEQKLLREPSDTSSNTQPELHFSSSVSRVNLTEMESGLLSANLKSSSNVFLTMCVVIDTSLPTLPVKRKQRHLNI